MHRSSPLVLLIFICLPFLSFGQTVEQKVDSLKALIEESNNDSLIMEWYNQLRKVTLTQNLSDAKQYATEYLNLAAKLGLDFKIAIGHFYKANIFIHLTEYEEALSHLFETLDYFESQNDSSRMAKVYNSIGAAYENLGKDSLTLTYFEKGYHLSLRMKVPTSTAIALNNLSNVYFRMGDFEKCEALLNEALALIEDPEHINFYGQISSNLANILMESGKYEEAEVWYRKNLEASKENDVFVYTANLKGLGRAKLKQGENKAALEYLKEAYNLMEENAFYNMRTDLLEDLPIAYEKTGNITQAYQTLKSFVALQDSTFTEEKTQALNDALQKYEADKKAQQISLLSSQNDLKDLKISQNRRERIIYIFGLLGLAVIAVLAVRNFRIKSKANTALEGKNKVIAKALDEKNLLLKEIHHRVKNNLQVVSSLLNLQSRYIQDDSALEAINESRNRVRSMSLLHQNLYQGENLTGVEVQHYLNQLIDGLFSTYNIKPGKIRLVKDIQAMELDVDTLIPIGLIVNELISNALKYAFPGDQSGEITISLQEKEDQLFLKVTDNGIGINATDFEASKSFGNRMIQTFVDRLDGEMAISNDKGTSIQLQFREYKAVS